MSRLLLFFVKTSSAKADLEKVVNGNNTVCRIVWNILKFGDKKYNKRRGIFYFFHRILDMVKNLLCRNLAVKIK